MAKAPRGAPDVFPPTSDVVERLESVARELFRVFGYRRIDTPVFEHTEVFARGLGESSDIVSKEMYTFQDRSERSLTLRPEGTAGVVRAYVEHGLHQQIPQPARLFYMGPMFRYERPQAGRKRQFLQFGPEAIGSDSPVVDAEIILWGVRFFAAAGLQPELLLNSMGCPADREAYGPLIRAALSEHSEEMCDDCIKRLETNPLRVFDCKVESCRDIIDSVDVVPLSETLCADCREHHRAVQSNLEVLGVRWKDAPKLVRGMDYYTRTVFEFDMVELGARSAVAGGGRYDGLVELFGGQPTPAVGMAVGVEPTLVALSQLGEFEAPRPDIYFGFLSEELAGVSMALSMDIRSAGLVCITSDGSRSAKSLLRSAARHNAKFVVIFGERDAEAGAVQVKNLDTGEQTEVALDGVVEHLRSQLC